MRSAADQADAEYRLGALAQREGRTDDAMVRYQMALAQASQHDAAREALANLLLGQRRFDEAEDLLRQGMAQSGQAVQFAQALARLKVERGDSAGALAVLQQHSAAAEASAEFQAFMAALLNRLEQSGEAIVRYQKALRLEPNQARWWAGLGIALETDKQRIEARDAYLRARTLPGLPADLAAHVEARLKTLPALDAAQR